MLSPREAAGKEIEKRSQVRESLDEQGDLSLAGAEVAEPDGEHDRLPAQIRKIRQGNSDDVAGRVELRA